MNKAPHRFFRAMVLMSSGVALGCGGMSREDGQPSTSSESGSSSGGSPGGATFSGGSSGDGGNTTTGGASLGSAGDTSIGGFAGSPFVDPPPFACPPTQWDCSALAVPCGYGMSADGAGYGWDLPGTCACDPDRPATSDGCGASATFTCRYATTFNGLPLKEAIPFECSCVPTQDHCAEACNLAFDDVFDTSCDQDADAILCGCAVIYLK